MQQLSFSLISLFSSSLLLFFTSSSLSCCQPSPSHSLTEHSLITFIRSIVDHHSLFTALVGFSPSHSNRTKNINTNSNTLHISQFSRLQLQRKSGQIVSQWLFSILPSSQRCCRPSSPSHSMRTRAMLRTKQEISPVGIPLGSLIHLVSLVLLHTPQVIVPSVGLPAQVEAQ